MTRSYPDEQHYKSTEGNVFFKKGTDCGTNFERRCGVIQCGLNGSSIKQQQVHIVAEVHRVELTGTDCLCRRVTMGQRGSKQPQAQVLLLGLDNAGKSTLLYKLKHDASVTTSPTIGFNVEMLDVKKNRKNIALTVWDVGGQGKMREHWKSFHNDVAAVVFVVDSSDGGRLDEAHRELERTLRSEQLRGRPLILLANKQDVNGALTVTEISERFNLRKICASRDWFVHPCSASTGFGVEEAFKRVAQMAKLSSDTGTVKDNIKETVHYLTAANKH